jgi:glutaredoxin
MSKKIYIFTLSDCGHCSGLKRRLRKDQIDYTEVEITQNPEIWDQVVKQTKVDYVPIVFIKTNNKDEGEVYIPDKDYKSEDEIVEIIKSKL